MHNESDSRQTAKPFLSYPDHDDSFSHGLLSGSVPTTSANITTSPHITMSVPNILSMSLESSMQNSSNFGPLSQSMPLHTSSISPTNDDSLAVNSSANGSGPTLMSLPTSQTSSSYPLLSSLGETTTSNSTPHLPISPLNSNSRRNSSLHSPISSTSSTHSNKVGKSETKRKSKASTVYDMTPETARKNRCRICEKQFQRPSSLQTHYYSHTGEKLFKCPLKSCGREFNVKLNMTRHFKLHERDSLRGKQSVALLNSKSSTSNTFGPKNGSVSFTNNKPTGVTNTITQNIEVPMTQSDLKFFPHNQEFQTENAQHPHYYGHETTTPFFNSHTPASFPTRIPAPNYNENHNQTSDYYRLDFYQKPSETMHIPMVDRPPINDKSHDGFYSMPNRVNYSRPTNFHLNSTGSFQPSLQQPVSHGQPLHMFNPDPTYAPQNQLQPLVYMTGSQHMYDNGPNHPNSNDGQMKP